MYGPLRGEPIFVAQWFRGKGDIPVKVVADVHPNTRPSVGQDSC